MTKLTEKQKGNEERHFTVKVGPLPTKNVGHDFLFSTKRVDTASQEEEEQTSGRKQIALNSQQTGSVVCWWNVFEQKLEQFGGHPVHGATQKLEWITINLTNMWINQLFA